MRAERLAGGWLPAPLRWLRFWPVVAVDGVIGAVLALVIGAFVRLKLQVEESQSRLREQELAVRELAIAASQAQSRALQSQINPHFFFNTLNTISALIEDDPAAARQMIGRRSLKDILPA